MDSSLPDCGCISPLLFSFNSLLKHNNGWPALTSQSLFFPSRIPRLVAFPSER